PDRAALTSTAVQRILAAADASIRARGRFRIVLCGGDTPRAAYQGLRGCRAEWAAWQVYFGDDRCVPRGDPQRNSRMAGEAWLDHVALPPHQLHVIPAELGADAAAKAYAAVLR